MVMEKATPATPIIDPAMVERRTLAPLGLFAYRKSQLEKYDAPKLSSMLMNTCEATIESKAKLAGKNQ